MRKLLIKLLVCIALLNSTHSAAADKYDAEAAALTRAAAENGLALNQSSRGLVSKLSPYQPKDAVYLPTGGIFYLRISEVASPSYHNGSLLFFRR